MKASLRQIFTVISDYLIIALLALAMVLASINPLLAIASDDVPISVEVIAPTATIVPTVKANLPVGASLQDAKVDIEVTGADPFSLVQVFAQSTPVLIAQGFANAQGVFRARVTLPNNLEAGDHSMVAKIQLADGTTKELTLVKFTVTADGLIAPRKKKSGGSSGGTVTESPVPKPSGSSSPTPSPAPDGAGVLFVGGVEATSESTLNPLGEPARLSITVQNVYKSPYSVKVKFQVLSALSTVVAEIPEFTTSKIGKDETRLISAQTASKLGQWGLYTARVTVTPPTKIGSATLKPIIRESLFFVWPLLTLAVILALVLIVLLLRMYLLLWPVIEEEEAE